MLRLLWECIKCTPWRWPFKGWNTSEWHAVFIKWWLKNIWMHWSVFLWYNAKCIYGNVVVWPANRRIVVIEPFSVGIYKISLRLPPLSERSLNKFSLNFVLVRGVSLKWGDTFKSKVKSEKNSTYCMKTDLHWCDFRAQISDICLNGKCYELRLWRGMKWTLVSCTSLRQSWIVKR